MITRFKIYSGDISHFRYMLRTNTQPEVIIQKTTSRLIFSDIVHNEVHTQGPVHCAVEIAPKVRKT